jgi:signal peptidase I
MILKEIIDMIKNIAYGVLIALFIIKFIGGTAIVSQISMQTTLYDGEVLWVEKITPNFGTLRRGDIVTIYAPKIIKDQGNTLVKRIVAVEGDHLLIENGMVYVNGAAIKEEYTKGDYTDPPDDSKNNDIIISPGCIYCLGDNRTDPIHDSRDMGEIDLQNITGRVLFRFHPVKKMGLLVKDW